MPVMTNNEQVVTVGEGFSFWGFVFGWMWLIGKRVWVKGLAFMVVQLPLFFYVAAIGGSMGEEAPKPNQIIYLLPWAILVALNIYIGLNGNKWLKRVLIKRGYKSL